jgi:hypothetical protein
MSLSSSSSSAFSSSVAEPLAECHDLVLLLQSASSPLHSSTAPLPHHRQPPRTSHQQQRSGWFASPVKVRRPLTFTSWRARPSLGNDVSAPRHPGSCATAARGPSPCALPCEEKENRNHNSHNRSHNNNSASLPSRPRLLAAAAHHSSSSPHGPAPSSPTTSNRFGARLSLAADPSSSPLLRSAAAAVAHRPPPPRAPRVLPEEEEEELLLLGGGTTTTSTSTTTSPGDLGVGEEEEEEQGHVWGVPPEVWVLVFQQLTASDVCACRLTCARWCALASGIGPTPPSPPPLLRPPPRQ